MLVLMCGSLRICECECVIDSVCGGENIFRVGGRGRSGSRGAGIDMGGCQDERQLINYRQCNEGKP